MGTVVASKGQGKFKGSGALGIQVTVDLRNAVSVSLSTRRNRRVRANARLGSSVAAPVAAR